MIEFLLDPRTVGGSGIICSLFVIALVLMGKNKLNLPSLTISFLGGIILPPGAALLIYLFVDPKPAIETLHVYLPLAGFSLFWGGVTTVSQALLMGKDREVKDTKAVGREAKDLEAKDTKGSG